MAAPSTSSDLLEVLERSRLVTAEELERTLAQLRADRDLPADPGMLAERLVQSGLITPFQAEQLLAGRHKGFFVGKYVVLGLLGTGGMSKVYLAQHTIMKRPVALKVLPRASAENPAALERFHREARAVAALDHPNIVRAHHVDQDGDLHLHYLVMEYVPGLSIHECLKRFGPIPWRQAAHYVCQAADGLQHAHDAGMVHRDIKPANLLLDVSGTVKLLDMGLSTFFNERDRNSVTLTYGENVLGTADYLAPEQALDSHRVDIRADIYSLGGTFYCMLAGRPPVPDGTIAEKLLFHQRGELPPIQEVVPGLPDDVAAVVRKALAKKPEDRYQTPAELIDALLPFAEAGPLPFDPGQVVADRGISSPSSQRLVMPRSSVAVSPRLPSTVRSTRAAGGREAADPRGPGAAAKRHRIVVLGVVVCLSLAAAFVARHRGPFLPTNNWGTGESTGGSVSSTASPAAATSPTATALRPAGREAFEGAGLQDEYGERLGVPVRLNNSIGMELALIPPGEFRMGTSEAVISSLVANFPADPARLAGGLFRDESPAHLVVISRPFYLGVTEVTLGQFSRFVEETDYLTDAERDGQGGAILRGDKLAFDPTLSWRHPTPKGLLRPSADQPVAQISWNDAVAFCQWLSGQEDEEYRLPTEAEWESACRANTTTQWSFGDDKVAFSRFGWCRANWPGIVQPVGQKAPNRFGLLDMHGYLGEWCADWYSDTYYAESPATDPPGPPNGEYRVIRSGGAGTSQELCRSASRDKLAPTNRKSFLGFRVARTIAPPPTPDKTDESIPLPPQ